MANALYDEGRNAFLTGDIDWLSDDIAVLLLRSAGTESGPYYTADLAEDEFLSDIPDNADARPVTEDVLTTKTAVAGVADADDASFTEVTAGDDIDLILIYQDTGVEATSRLIALIDTAVNLPVTPNGGDITVEWDDGPNKIFKL